MQKIMFYCQYLTGLGHLARSVEIVRSLAPHFQVYLINGGPVMDGFDVPDEVEFIRLPALWVENGAFQIPDTCRSVEMVKSSRIHLLFELFDQIQPDCFITEFFPFGHHKLLFELLPLMDHIKATAPHTKLVCSLRDVIGRATLAQEADIICHLVNTYFDHILFHSDPSFQSFAESYPRWSDLHCTITSTGFVAQSNSAYPTLADDPFLSTIDEHNPMIVVSAGGGRLGFELLEAVISASPVLERHIPHCLQLFAGPFLPELQFQRLQDKVASCPNVRLRRFTPYFLNYMEKADLSISLTGYNTIMNILSTGVRSLVVPIGYYRQDQEQLTRTRKLAKRKLVEVLNLWELGPEMLTRRILNRLERSPLPQSFSLFDLQGAEKTAIALQCLLAEPSTDAYVYSDSMSGAVSDLGYVPSS